MTAARKRFHLVIRGRVQGVYFRQSTKAEADRLGVSGWVRNLPDGDVEALVDGPAQAVDALIRWCHRGPPAAHVIDVRVREEPVSEVSEGTGQPLSGFDVRR